MYTQNDAGRVKLILGGNLTRDFRFLQGQVIFIIHGWRNDCESDFCQMTKNSLVARGHIAVIMDWGTVANNLYINTT